LERKPGALDFARPLKGLSLPESFQVLRQRLETADPQKGTREFIRVLRLHEECGQEELTAAVQAILRLPRITAADVRVVLERAGGPGNPLEFGEPAAIEDDPGAAARLEGIRRTPG
jgi:hypothetical protein